MIEKNNGCRLIFIGGSPRSGTTLVQNMLDSHPQILGGPEFINLPNVVELRRSLHASISKGWIDIICSRDDVDSYIIAFIEKIFLRLADSNHSEFYSEKTPMNILVFSELIEIFTEAHFIQVIRDPRAIVSSMQQVKKRAVAKGVNIPDFTANLSSSIAYVKKCFKTGFEASKNAPDKVLTIVYEHLLLNPEIESKKICDFLGVEWDDAMLHPSGKEHLGQQAITTKSDEIWYDAKAYNRNPDSQNIDKWQSELTLGQQIRTIVAFKDNEELRQYGYNFSLDSLTQANHFLSRLYYLYFQLGRAIYRYLPVVVRKIPGISLVKRGLLAVAKLLG